MTISEIQQRVFIGDIIDKRDVLHEVQITFDELTMEDGSTECQNEQFELNEQFVTYDDLTGRFGKAKVNAFIETANEDAR